jgi:hypothetical protein
MTAQEIFDKVLAHLRTQGEPALDYLGTCAYRGRLNETTGKSPMCAIGCLIPDDKYDPTMEGGGIYLVKDHAPDSWDCSTQVLSGVLTDLGLNGHLELLNELQSAHDECLTVCKMDFEDRMRYIAKDHQLTYTPAQEPTHAD